MAKAKKIHFERSPPPQMMRTDAAKLFWKMRTDSLVYGRWGWLRILPKILASGLVDAFVLVTAWLLLRLLPAKATPLRETKQRSEFLDVAFLYPFPLQRASPGGEMSYLKGFLSGLFQKSGRCEIFSGCSLPVEQYPVHLIPNRRRFYLLRESQALSYNLHFAKVVMQALRQRPPRVLYQRHGRFVLVGLLLSRWLHIPLVLEYQASEHWRAKNWDPGRFLELICRCEDLTISSSALVVVLSEVLKDEVLARGVASDRIIVNPAAVDPERFRPGCGGLGVRNQLGFPPDAIVVGFVGTFSYYHGISVLQKAIESLLLRRMGNGSLRQLRFLLIGDGELRADMQESLRRLESGSDVVFTGSLRHELIPSYLDACDLLVSPHVPMQDGQPFFGSPSKLFEYMAMGKAIIASNMDQIAEVLEHGKTAWLVQPGSDLELSNAVELLAGDLELRSLLACNVRRAVVERYTWGHNAERFLSAIGSVEKS